MVNTYTKIKLKNLPLPSCISLDQNMMSFQRYEVMLHTMSSPVPKKKWIHSQDKFDLTFSLGSNLAVHSPYDPELIWPPSCDFRPFF